MANIKCEDCGFDFDESEKTQCPNCNAPIGTFRLICKKDRRVLEERITTLPSKGSNVLMKTSHKNNVDVELEFIYRAETDKYNSTYNYLDELKKRGIVIVALLMLAFVSFAQKKPTIMILPSDNWCTQRYFISEYENQGEIISVPNYQQAFQEDLELGPVISKIGELMTALGYSLKDAEMELKNISTRIAEDNVIFSKSSGVQFTESPLDMLKRRAKADIIIQISWVLKQTSITFTLEAFDAYTSKRIATATGTSKDNEEDIALVLQKAVERQIKPFDRQMNSFYKKMQSEGREIVLTIRTWDNWENDLESEIEGEELLNHIQTWMQQNTVNEQFNLSDATENFAQFEQVKIPLKNKSGLNMDARSFARELQKFLDKSPYNISSKLMIRGLGEAILVLGEK